MWSGAQVDLTGLYKDVGFHGEIPGSLVQVQLTPTEQLSFKSSDTTTILDVACVSVALIDHESHATPASILKASVCGGINEDVCSVGASVPQCLSGRVCPFFPAHLFLPFSG